MGETILRAIEAVLALGAGAVLYSWWQVSSFAQYFVG